AKWEANDHDAGQAVTGHVDPLPEAAAAQQDVMRVVPELAEQLTSCAVEVLCQHPHAAAGEARPEPVGDLAKLLVRGEEHKGSTLDGFADFGNHGGDLVDERRIVKLAKVGRQTHQGL